MVKSLVSLAGAKLRQIDLATWILILGIIVRADVALRFDPDGGYDAPTHMAYTALLKDGIIPRVGVTTGGATYATQNPPVFYSFALLFDVLGLGRWGGVLVAFLAGCARLFMADWIFKRELSTRARIFANTLHAFIPFSIRIDVFYSPEGLAGCWAVAAVVLALAQKKILSGVALGLALLTKASAVAAGPAVALALFTTGDHKLRWSFRSAFALVLAGAMLLPWAHYNVKAFGTPYPSAYLPEVKQYPHLWNQPLHKKHKLEFFLPRFRYKDIGFPYSDNRPSMPDVLLMEAWGDYYNYLGNPKKETMRVNGHPLNPAMRFVHQAGVVVGVLTVIFTIAGFFGTVIRAVRRRISRGDAVLSLLGITYLGLASWYATYVPYEYHGAVKATYALAAAPALAMMTARAFDKFALRGAKSRKLIWGLAFAPVIVALLHRIVW